MGFPGGAHGKEPTCQFRGQKVRSLGGEDPLEEEMATHSRIPAWRIPWTDERGGQTQQNRHISRVAHTQIRTAN